MRIAVMADIHSNSVAFDRCIREALWRGVDSFILLGDYLADMANPEKVMKQIYELKENYPCYIIKGNKEDYWINHRHSKNKGEWIDYNSTTGMLYYTYNHLSDKDLDFFEELSFCKRLDFEGLSSITICHGSPFRANEDMIRGTERMNEIVSEVETKIILCAHTHRQWEYDYEGKRVINPGSVGLPLGSEGKTQFAILDDASGDWDVEFVSLSYNIEKTISEMDEAKLSVHAPYWSFITKKTLRYGKDYQFRTLKSAMHICEEENGSCNWPGIPEGCWKRAVEIA